MSAQPSRTPCRLDALGIANSLGATPDDVGARLERGDVSRLTLRDDLVPGRALWWGQVHESLPPVPERLARYACRNNRLTLAALAPIGERIADLVAAVGADRVGVVMGTSTSGVSDAEIAIRHELATGELAPDFAYAQLEFGGTAAFLADYLGVTGPTYTLSTACSSGARALATARSLIALGLCDVVLAGATDSLCGLTSNGFAALSALAETVTNPLSANRRGLTLGEASAIFLVTGEPGGIQLVGVGESSEAHHMSAPHPEGRGAETSMVGALADAGLPPEAIDYLNLHGTGTPLNDSMESRAVSRVLGERVPVSSTKPMVGHSLGAAGAMEAGFCWLLLDRMRSGTLLPPPHIWDGVRDPELPELRLVQPEEQLDLSGRGTARVMSNSFGFGGNNCTLILARDIDEAAP